MASRSPPRASGTASWLDWLFPNSDRWCWVLSRELFDASSWQKELGESVDTNVTESFSSTHSSVGVPTPYIPHDTVVKLYEELRSGSPPAAQEEQPDDAELKAAARLELYSYARFTINLGSSEEYCDV